MWLRTCFNSSSKFPLWEYFKYSVCLPPDVGQTRQTSLRSRSPLSAVSDPVSPGDHLMPLSAIFTSDRFSSSHNCVLTYNVMMQIVNWSRKLFHHLGKDLMLTRSSSSFPGPCHWRLRLMTEFMTIISCVMWQLSAPAPAAFSRSACLHWSSRVWPERCEYWAGPPGLEPGATNTSGGDTLGLFSKEPSQRTLLLCSSHLPSLTKLLSCFFTLSSWRVILWENQTKFNIKWVGLYDY